MTILTKEQAIAIATELKVLFPQFSMKEIAAVMEYEITKANVRELIDEDCKI